MTPLEKRLIDDMKLFGSSKRTQYTYLYAVRKITNHFQTSRLFKLQIEPTCSFIAGLPLDDGLAWNPASFVPCLYFL